MGPKLGDLAFIYILTGFRKETQDGISRGQKEREQESSKQQKDGVWIMLFFFFFTQIQVIALSL